jgi:hypothetical protein
MVMLGVGSVADASANPVQVKRTRVATHFFMVQQPFQRRGGRQSEETGMNRRERGSPFHPDHMQK